MLRRLVGSLALCCAGAMATPATPLPADGEPDENILITLLRAEAASYEHGNGVPQDGPRAASLYCQAARLGDPESQFSLGWMYTNGRGVERSDSTAAFFFHAAAEQGYEQARHMLRMVGGPPNSVPECMRAAPLPAAAPVLQAARPAPPAILNTAPKDVADLVLKMAPDFGVQPELALAIIEAESNYNIVALSPRNAKGLMQLIPETAARFNVSNPYDPTQNIRGGLSYLRWLLAYFEGDVTLVAAAYNAGEGTVERYRGVPPYVETRAYVRRILKAAGLAVHPYDTRVTAPSRALRLIRAR
nr:transglycosylase SLT domain-containing protein [uncultured Caldimonas sp.]